MKALGYALNTWNAKLSEIWPFIAQLPETFQGSFIEQYSKTG